MSRIGRRRDGGSSGGGGARRGQMRLVPVVALHANEKVGRWDQRMLMEAGAIATPPSGKRARGIAFLIAS